MLLATQERRPLGGEQELAQADLVHGEEPRRLPGQHGDVTGAQSTDQLVRARIKALRLERIARGDAFALRLDMGAAVARVGPLTMREHDARVAAYANREVVVRDGRVTSGGVA